MKPTLQLKISQQLAMTPQLQQAIRLLQLSSLDLQTEIQQALESNPLLEVADEQSENTNTDAKESLKNNQTSIDNPPEPPNTTESHSDATDTQDTTAEEINNIPNDLPVDSAWDDIYQSNYTSSNTSTDHEDLNAIDRNSSPETLYDHLIWQLNLTPLSKVDKAIGIAILEALDETGYLTVSVEDIYDTIAKEKDLLLAADQTLELEEVIAVLHLIQQFDPPGIAATSLQDCLLIQLKQLSDETPWRTQALRLVRDFIHLMGNRDYTQLVRKLKLSETDLKKVIALIQELNPYPGRKIQDSKTAYITPDVIVRKHEKRWLVELNPDISPQLKINTNYASLAKSSKSTEDSNYIKNNLQEAKWFIKSLQSRNETLLKVATKIVEYQIGFFEYGHEAMKPLVLHDIAQAVEMHESTISRVTTQKYMMTPYGIFELKYFFSSHVNTTSGGECSSKAIQAIIRKFIEAENKKKPLSDNSIAKMLGEKGIKIARRTIAKYRESLNIPPSNERKCL